MSRSKSAHDLSGLMKYADRAPWDEALAEMLSAHLDPASEATGLEPDAIFEIIGDHWQRSEEHTSELQSLMRISYAVFCLKKKINTHTSRIITKTYHNRKCKITNNTTINLNK